MKLVSSKYRTSEAEVMDSFELGGNQLKKILKDIESVNRLLGGNRVTINGLEKLNLSGGQIIHIADIGCGSGQMLREIAKWGRKKNLKLNLTGIDANENTIEIAKTLSDGLPEISFETQNIFSEEFKESSYDVVSISLTLHHFPTEKIKDLLQILTEKTKRAIIINDLHRSNTTYYLFWLFCLVFVRSPVAKADGLISILRGFKRAELITISTELQLKNFQINWFWAFRYQWIIQTKRNN